jgi:prepilin-type processing-associated H-X9-DG protein
VNSPDWSNYSFRRLSNYVNTVRIFRCPSHAQPAQGWNTNNFATFVTANNACSYSIARHLSWQMVFKDFAIAFDRVGTGQGNPAGSDTPGPLTFNLLSTDMGASPSNAVAGAKWVGGNHGQAGGNILFGDGRVNFAAKLPVDIRTAPLSQNLRPNQPITAQNPR